MVIYLERIMSKKILVTGGSGLVGKHLKDILPNAWYFSSKDYDLTECQDVRDMIRDNKPDVVVHLAARVGGILDNITYPVEYLEQNILMNTNVLKQCQNSNSSFQISRALPKLNSDDPLGNETPNCLFL